MDDEEQNKDDKNIQKVFEKERKDQEDDSAGDVATHREMEKVKAIEISDKRENKRGDSPPLCE